MFKILDPDPLPSFNFLIKKEFNDYTSIQKLIFEKEALFKICNFHIQNFSLEAVQLEQELGDLYREFLKSYHTLKKHSK